MGRIRYGIRNTHYAKATDDGTGVLTYASPKAIPGAKSISLDAQGDAVDEYADNITWWHGDTNNGYSGSIEFEDTESADAFLIDTCGWEKDPVTGIVTEKASDTPSEFALGFQFELAGGKDTGKRTWLYRCTASRPSIAGSTKESGVTVQTNTVNITAMPRLNDDKVKQSVVSTDPAYNTFFAAVEQARIAAPSVSANDTVLWNVPMSDIQEDIAVSGKNITGTLKFLSGSNAITDVWGEGNFIALKFGNIVDGDIVSVGITPSQGTGMQDLDEDKNALFKVADKDSQVITVVTKRGVQSRTDMYSLSDLTVLSE